MQDALIVKLPYPYPEFEAEFSPSLKPNGE
jgi:hypothetical protein